MTVCVYFIHIKQFKSDVVSLVSRSGELSTHTISAEPNPNHVLAHLFQPGKATQPNRAQAGYGAVTLVKRAGEWGSNATGHGLDSLVRVHP